VAKRDIFNPNVLKKSGNEKRNTSPNPRKRDAATTVAGKVTANKTAPRLSRPVSTVLRLVITGRIVLKPSQSVLIVVR
jgi:hypothetical protein